MSDQFPDGEEFFGDVRSPYSPAERAELERHEAERAERYRRDCERGINWLGSLPADTLIGWNSHHVSDSRPYAADWVDVIVPMLTDALGWNWGWTIEVPWAELDSDPFSLHASFDAVLEMRPDGRDPDDVHQQTQRRSACLRALRLRLPNGALLDLAGCYQRGDEYSEMEWLHTRNSGFPLEIDGETWSCSPVWTPAAVSKALNRWVTDWTGRKDVRFCWQPAIPDAPHIRLVKALAADVLAEDGGGEPLPTELTTLYPFASNDAPDAIASVQAEIDTLTRLAIQRSRAIEAESSERAAHRHELHGLDDD